MQVPGVGVAEVQDPVGNYAERISLREIYRTAGISRPRLLHFMVEYFAAWPDDLHVRRPAEPTMDLDCHRCKTCQVIACHVRDRSRESAKAL